MVFAFGLRTFASNISNSVSMVNYYDILKVSPQSSGAEIKSAYRRLARKLHPDNNQGSEETALKFAAIAEAYEILGNSKERARYDRRILEAQYNGNGNGDSVFASKNRHARRWRQMVYEKRYNDIIDRMMAEERAEATAFQKVVYPLVALFISAILSSAFKPRLFAESGVIGRIILVSLFVVGVIHIAGRIRDGFERYTEIDDDIHDSILNEGERKRKPYSRLAAAASLLGGLILCFGLGLLIGTQIEFLAKARPDIFFETFQLPESLELLVYPPIVTLLVDLMHTFVSSFER